MKVSVLIEQLQQLNPDFDIGIANEDHDVVQIQFIVSSKRAVGENPSALCFANIGVEGGVAPTTRRN